MAADSITEGDYFRAGTINAAIIVAAYRIVHLRGSAGSPACEAYRPPLFSSTSSGGFGLYFYGIPVSDAALAAAVSFCIRTCG